MTFKDSPTAAQESLRYSVLDGSAHSAMLGTTQDYMSPYALAMNATTAQVGLLASIPNLFMCAAQLAAPKLVEKLGSRKRLILPAVFLHALMWLPILLVPFVFDSGKVWWLIGLVAISTLLGTIGNPAWGSMMAQLVPSRSRGSFFGMRGRICNLMTLLFSIASALLLYSLTSQVMLVFAGLFGSAAIFRLASWYFLSKMHEPPLPAPETGRKQVRPSTSPTGLATNTGRFILFVSLMHFATYLAAPFFAVYILQDLGFNYLTYVLVVSTPVVANLLSMTFWGRCGDRAGNLHVIRLTSICIPIVPVLWLFGSNLYYLVPLQLLSGFAWAGFNLCTVNFLYDATKPSERTHVIARYNAINGAAICLGSLIGGLLAMHLPPMFGFSLLTLFLLSGLLRGLVAALFLNRVTEVRPCSRSNILEGVFGGMKLVPAFNFEAGPALVPATLAIGNDAMNDVRMDGQVVPDITHGPWSKDLSPPR